MTQSKSGCALSTATSVVHPAEDTLQEFNPDENLIDKKIYEGIIEPEPDKHKKFNHSTPQESPDKFNLKSDDEDSKDLIISDSSSSGECVDDVDDLYTVGGKQGF